MARLTIRKTPHPLMRNSNQHPKLDQLYLPYLEAFCTPEQKQPHPALSGIYREVRPEIGQGYYWYYPIDDVMAINISNFKLSAKVEISCFAPDFFCFGKFNRNIVQYFCDGTNRQQIPSSFAPKILGYAWRNSTFTDVLEAGKSFKCAGISLLPEAVAYLSSHFAGETHALSTAISELDGSQLVPGLDELFDVLFNIQLGTSSAHVFYESKIYEATSLLVDWWHKKQIPDCPYINPSDLSALNITTDYIHSHLSEQLTLPKLCRIACMSPSKLSGLFKKKYKKTPMEFVRKIRLEQACKMLVYRDIPLGEIALKLGFAHQGSFSEAFKAHYKLSPLAYRQAHSQRHPTKKKDTDFIAPTDVFYARYGNKKSS